MLRDGCTSEKKPAIQMVCHAIDEKEFCLHFVLPMIRRLFRVKPTLYKKKGKLAYGMSFGSRALISHLADKYDFPLGEAPKRVPPPILQASLGIQKHFVRGLFDADGTLVFSKKTYSKHQYPSIELKNKHREFLLEVERMLDGLGFRTSIGKSVESWVLRINGREMLILWMRVIGSANLKHTSKYLVWRKSGYCPPATTVPERLGLLNKTS